MKTINEGIIVIILILLNILLLCNPGFSKTDTPGIPLESNPRGIAINPLADIAVVANEKSDSVSIVDINAQAVLTTIPVGKAPRGVAIDRELNIAVIGDSHDDTISIIDLNTYHVIATIPVGKQPEGIAVNPATHTAFIANHKDNTVSVINLTSLSVISTIPVGKEPIDVAIDPELNIAVVVNEKDYNVSVVDLNTFQETGIISLEKKPQAIDVNPETHRAAVVNEKDNSITVIDLQTWETYTLSVDKHPIEIAINSLDNRALVICDEDRSMLLIDLDTRTIVQNYALNKLPRGVAVNNFTNIAAIVDDKTDSLTLIELPNPVPEITSLVPDSIGRGGDGLSTTIEGKKFMVSSIAYFGDQPLTTNFIDNNKIQANIQTEMLSNAGIFPVTVRNPQPEGGTSNRVDFTVINPVPSITALDPAEAMAGTLSLILDIYGLGFFNDTEVYFNGVKKSASYLSNTKLQAGLTSVDLETPGDYDVKTFNLPPGGGFSNTVTFTVKTPLEVYITSPNDGETINKAKVIVKGTFVSGTQDIGITVNGIIAEIIGNEWIANNVPLTVGENILTATAIDSHGNRNAKSITIHTDDATQQVELFANITSGISQLTTYFSETTSFVPVSYQMDFEGDGIVDYTGASFDDINHTYTSEGIFYPTLTVTDEQGNTYSDTTAIIVISKGAIDIVLQEKWADMKEELVKGNIEGALEFFIERSKDRYRSVFEALEDQLPVIMETFIEFNIVNVFENIAEYEIVANEGGVLYSYPGVLIKNGNGIWKFRDF